MHETALHGEIPGLGHSRQVGIYGAILGYAFKVVEKKNKCYVYKAIEGSFVLNLYRYSMS